MWNYIIKLPDTPFNPFVLGYVHTADYQCKKFQHGIHAENLRLFKRILGVDLAVDFAVVLMWISLISILYLVIHAYTSYCSVCCFPFPTIPNHFTFLSHLQITNIFKTIGCWSKGMLQNIYIIQLPNIVFKLVPRQSIIINSSTMQGDIVEQFIFGSLYVNC